MRVSRERLAENRRRILEAAGRLFRAKGFEAVTVAEVMQAAGLTHGGFYGHFRSKDDLITQALAHAVLAGEDRQRSRAEIDLARYAAGYLSPRHRDDLAGGCPTAALGAETIRQSPEARAAMTAGLRPGFTHEKPRAERDGRLQNRTSSPALRGAPVSRPKCVFAEQTQLPKRSHA